MVFTHRPLVLERWELVAKFPTLKYASFWPTERQECLTLKHALPTHIKSGCGSLTMTNKVLKKRYKWNHKFFYCDFVKLTIFCLQKKNRLIGLEAIILEVS